MSERNLEPAEQAWNNPSWVRAELVDGAEGWIIEWRERHPQAFFELAEMCSLAVWSQGWREATPDERTPERVEEVFKALQTLVEIDPDARR